MAWLTTARRHVAALGATVLLATVPSWAFDLPRSWTEPEKQWFEAMQLSSAFQTHGIAHLQAMQAAKDTLRIHRKISRCPGITTSNSDGMLDLDYRRVVESGPANVRAKVLDREGKIFQYLEGSALWAFRQQTPEELGSFLRLSRDPSAKRAITLLAQVTFLEQFPAASVEYLSFDFEPAAVIWLKQYFFAEDDLDNLDRAVAVAAPEVLMDFRRVGNFEAHTTNDGEWLRALTARVSLASHRIANQLWLQQPEDVRATALQIMSRPSFGALSIIESADRIEFGKRARMRQLLGLQLPGPSGLVPLDGQSEQRVEEATRLLKSRLWPGGAVSMPAITRAFTAAYPEPAEFDQLVSSMGPAEILGAASLKRLCMGDAR